MAKKTPPPPPPGRCPHNTGTTAVPYDMDGKTGYHYRCNGCTIILRTDEPR